MAEDEAAITASEDFLIPPLSAVISQQQDLLQPAPS